MISQLHTKIVECRQRLEALERERDEVLSELLTNLRRFGGADLEELVSEKTAEKNINDEAIKKLSKQWKSILSHFAAFKDFNATDVERAVHELRAREPEERKRIKQQTAGNIRTQLCAFVKKGVVRRVGSGRYLIPTSTKHALGINTQQKDSGVAHDSRVSSAGDAR